MRFKVESTEHDGEECSSPYESETIISESVVSSCKSTPKIEVDIPTETVYPSSISIDALMKAGQLVKPKKKNQVSLTLEKFNINDQEWEIIEPPLDLLVETETFSSGGFRDAFWGVSKTKKKWVIKTYKETAKETITTTLQTSIENHTRKQIQMHSAARHLANLFTSKAPGEFGQCFKFNRAYYTVYAGNPVTVEEFVEGTFRKYVNNDGKICKQLQGSNADIKTTFEKAECLVHFSYVESSKKLMLLDLQGAKYNLYDPDRNCDNTMAPG